MWMAPPFDQCERAGYPVVTFDVSAAAGELGHDAVGLAWCAVHCCYQRWAVIDTFSDQQKGLHAMEGLVITEELNGVRESHVKRLVGGRAAQSRP